MAGVLARLVAAIVAGIGAWCSWGVLAVASSGGRLGALPSAWWLAAAVLVALVIVFGSRWSTTRVLPLFGAVVFLLPWLPGTTVFPALIFSGPITWFWWILIAAGCAFAGPPPRVQALEAVLSDPRRAPWIAGAIVFSVTSAGAVNFQDYLPGADEPHYLVITQSLLHDGDLQIENNHVRGDYFAYYPSDLKPDFLRRGTNRQIYSVHAPGLSALVLPAFAIGGYPGVVVFLLVCGALGAALAWWLGYLVTGDATAAWVGWAVVVTSITFIVHTFTIFPDGVSGVCVLVGVWTLLVARTHPAWRIALHATAVAFLPWLHTRNAPLALVIGLACAWPLLRARDWPRLAAWMVPLAASALAWLAFFRIIYGEFNPGAPYNGYGQSSLAFLPAGALGLLFDQQFGLIAYAPALAVGIVGIAALARLRRSDPSADGGDTTVLTLTLIAVLVSCLLLSGTYGMWWGGASAPARFLTPIVLPLAVPAAAAWSRWRSRATRSVIVALVLVSACMAAALLSLQRGILTFNGRDGFATLADFVSPVADLSQALPSIHRDPLGVAAVRALLWTAVPMVVWIGLRLVPSRTSRGAAALVAFLAGTVATVGATTIAWSLRGVRGDRGDLSQAMLASAIADARATTIPVAFRDAPRIDIPGRTERSLKRVDAADLVTRLSFSTTLRRAPRNTAFAAGPLPAGRFRVSARTRDAAAGRVDVAIGRDGAALRVLEWERPAGEAAASVEVDLAIPVRVLTVRGEAAALSAVSEVTVAPVSVRAHDARLGADDVVRLARNGGYFLYLLSEGQFVERDGLWLRPNRDVSMIVARDGDAPTGPLQVFLRNGPLENDVTVTGKTSTSLHFAPGEERAVPVDVEWVDGAARITINAARGFRPREVDPSSTDPRMLGVWVMFPG